MAKTMIADKTGSHKAARPPFTLDGAMDQLSERGQLQFRCNGLGWFFARVTECDRRLTYRLGGPSFARFLRRMFPQASKCLLDRVARRCRFLALLTSAPAVADDLRALFSPPTTIHRELQLLHGAKPFAHNKTLAARK